EIFRRDVFSFWEPLDEKFTEVMIHFAHCHRVQFLSLFWSRHLFAYLDYSDELEKAPVTIAFQRANHATVRNLLMGRYSNMGKHYSALIRGRKGRLDVSFRNGKRVSGTKSPHLGRVCILGRGARPRFSPDGKLIVFDRKNPDGFYDVYLMNLKGHIVRSLTDGRSDFLHRHNGNATIHPSGKFVVFLSEEEHHPWLELFWLGDPGLGLFCNLWATDLEGRRFWKLTNIPIKRDISDATPVFGVVNPLFSPDGEWLLWTERFGHGGHHNWGRWRVKRARWMLKEGKPSLEGEEVLFVPRRGNYVTAMGFLDKSHLLIAGNLDGQHEYGMDQYVLDLATRRLTNLHNTPKFWEEDAAITPDGRHIIYMSNATSRYALNFDDPNWVAQPREREYWLMSADKGHRERLTYFNEPSAPEYLGRRIIVAAADISPDGKWLVGTLGIDFGDESRAKIALKVVLFELNIR
ncbi:MAG TPA: hypothetical protein EYP10_11670, partial [Armatimonadetes bacterium]|nr:hypothetical protein [Armatimonadota bacterium]